MSADRPRRRMSDSGEHEPASHSLTSSYCLSPHLSFVLKLTSVTSLQFLTNSSGSQFSVQQRRGNRIRRSVVRTRDEQAALASIHPSRSNHKTSTWQIFVPTSLYDFWNTWCNWSNKKCYFQVGWKCWGVNQWEADKVLLPVRVTALDTAFDFLLNSLLILLLLANSFSNPRKQCLRW